MYVPTGGMRPAGRSLPTHGIDPTSHTNDTMLAAPIKRCSQCDCDCDVSDCDKTCQSAGDVIISSYFYLLTSISYVIRVP